MGGNDGHFLAIGGVILTNGAIVIDGDDGFVLFTPNRAVNLTQRQ